MSDLHKNFCEKVDQLKLHQIKTYHQICEALEVVNVFKSICQCQNPFFFYSSGSMEPAFYRGDLLFLTNYREEPIRVGEIVVFKVEGREIPIVHRVLKVHEK